MITYKMIGEFLVCPKCRGELELVRLPALAGSEKEVIVCRTCNAYYPIEDGIPVLLIEEAKNLNDE